MTYQKLQNLIVDHVRGIRRWQVLPSAFDKAMILELTLRSGDNPITKHLEFFFSKGPGSLATLAASVGMKFDPLERDDFILYEAGLAKQSINAYNRLRRDGLRLIKNEVKISSSFGT